jgi:hypothetical protein
MKFRLPEKPLLRPASALRVRSLIGASAGPNGGLKGEKANKRLRNVHVHCPPPTVPDGLIRVVEGSYDYYHYMQNRFNDKVGNNSALYLIQLATCDSFIDICCISRAGAVLIALFKL